jgi:hypothetical protein
MTTLTIRRRGLAPPTIQPALIRLTPASFGVSSPTTIRRGRLRVPSGWHVESPAPLAWFVTPSLEQLDLDAANSVWLEVERTDGSRQTYARSIGIQLDLETTFNPDVHAFPQRNNAAAIGDIGPTFAPFLDTFKLSSGRMANLLYRGLYSDIVQLRLTGSHRGGLCSGMARWAGLRALRGEAELPEQDAALDQIKTLHGRQLTDKALFSSLGWFLRASPTAAYRAVRDDAFATGKSLRALDIGVPKPWRKDIATAIVREGHTIVPFRVRQLSPQRAFVDCYDPNRGRETHTIEFHLDSGRYAYRNKVSFEDDNIGLIAVPHEYYAKKGTAILATIGSLIWLALGLGGGDQKPDAG